MSATTGQKLAGELLGFFGILAIIAVGLFYFLVTLIWMFPDQSIDSFKHVGYYTVALLIGAVGQSLGGVLVYAGGYLEGKRRRESEKQLLLGTAMMIVRDVVFVFVALYLSSAVFALMTSKYTASGALMGLFLGCIGFGYLMKQKIDQLNSKHK